MTHVYTRERHENKNTHFWATYSLVPGALTDISRDTRGHSFTRVEERRGEMCEKLPPRGVGYADAFPRASRDRVEHQSAGEEAGPVTLGWATYEWTGTTDELEHRLLKGMKGMSICSAFVASSNPHDHLTVRVDSRTLWFVRLGGIAFIKDY